MAEKSDSMIQIRGLSVEYRTPDGTVKALNGLDLELRKGKTLGLVGETGAGKTTAGLSMLRLIQEPPGVITSGQILFRGENLLEKSEQELEKIRGKHISMIFQDPMTALNPVFTMESQIAESIQLHEDVTQEQARQAEAIVTQACPNAEISLLPGGQPVYYYMISAE